MEISTFCIVDLLVPLSSLALRPLGMIRVAVLHADLLVGRDLQYQLRSADDLQVVLVAHERQRLLDGLRPLGVEAVVVDAGFEGGEAFPICQEVELYAPRTRVLVYATSTQAPQAKRMLHRGAAGCVLDADGPEALQEGARLVGSGGHFVSTDAALYLLGIRRAFDPQHAERPRTTLTRREKQVTRAILEERTTGEIAELLNISFGTVETHRRNILAKVGARNTAGLVRCCYEMELLAD